MRKNQNKFFPPRPASSAKRDYLELPFDDPEAPSMAKQSSTVVLTKKGAVKSDFNPKRKKKGLRKFDPSLEHEMVGPSMSQFTGYRPGRRWGPMRLPNRVPDGFLNGSQPAPFSGPHGAGNFRGTGTARRAIQTEQRNAATLRAFEDRENMTNMGIDMAEKYNMPQLSGAVKAVLRENPDIVPPDVKGFFNRRDAPLKKDFINKMIQNENLHTHVMEYLEEKGEFKGTPGRKSTQSIMDSQRSHFETKSNLTQEGIAEPFSTAPVNRQLYFDIFNRPTSTDDASFEPEPEPEARHSSYPPNFDE